MQRERTDGVRVRILMPIYNDWNAAEALLARVDACLSDADVTCSVLIVDDGSTLLRDASFGAGEFRCIEEIRILRLRRNLGHQRAICLGLCHLQDQGIDCPLVIMDSDGEDAAEDVSRLLERYHAEEGKKVVFAARIKRSEGFVFRLGYLLFRWLHLLLTGHSVRVGNFSVLPPSAVSALVVSSELWSHYAAAVVHVRIPWCDIPTSRARRLDGSTQMNLVGLVVHGLAAISVFSDIVGVRLLLVCVLLMSSAMTGILGVVFVRLFTELAIPGWATYSVALLAIFVLQSLMMAGHFSFVILSGRIGAMFLPTRDHGYFVGKCETVFRRSPSGKRQE